MNAPVSGAACPDSNSDAMIAGGTRRFDHDILQYIEECPILDVLWRNIFVKDLHFRLVEADTAFNNFLREPLEFGPDAFGRRLDTPPRKMPWRVLLPFRTNSPTLSIRRPPSIY